MKKESTIYILYCIASYIMGVLIMIFGGINLAMVCYYLLQGNEFLYMERMWSLLSMPELIFRGLLLIGVSQFLRYVSDKEYRPGWILRKGEYIIYLAIIIFITKSIWKYCNFGFGCSGSTCSVSEMTLNQIFGMLISAGMLFAQVLIMFGIAQILRAMDFSASKNLPESE
ncbi:MAG: hypothetical protein JXD22_11435 [Sedimentisphaerales bacterium]|nr:hypothetical protein [Sedimentisphaerales bacterium]